MPSAVNGGRGADDDIVISGLSGRLPQSNNIEEFARQLFEGVDLVTADDTRWAPGTHGLPERNGRIKNLSHFDATFFGVHAKQAHLMDPQLRMLLELTHEAIIDAGLNPVEMRGSRTGVFVGVSNSESEELWTADPDKINGYALTGCCRAMFPNRISYTFHLQGPSYAVDTACSSSSFALAQAFAAMRAGHCDAAVVAGTNICLKPTSSLNFHRLSMLSKDGACKAFDASGNGYVRSEAAVVVLLQRRPDARRIYCSVLNARTNTDGHKEQGITFPAGAVQRQLVEETYREVALDPASVAYVEAHGTGTRVGDPQEVNAIAEVFCAGRRSPVLLGSVKSNMGHSEPASGLCSVAKILLAMEARVIPGNLHFRKPNPDIPALSDGRIKVVDKNTPWEGGVVAMNSFGFGGANAHIIMRGGDTPGLTPAPTTPRVVCASGRTEDAVRAMLQHAAANAACPPLLSLLDAVHAHNVSGHAHRGYVVLDPAAQAAPVVAEAPADARPLWFVFSGMGSQWAGMGRSLLELPVTAASLRRCARALTEHKVDLLHVLAEAGDDAFDNVINCFVSIAAVQVALVDLLRAVGLKPEGFVGHSVGEIGCAYADETLTAEQAVLAAYWRGRSILDAKLPPGAMAAVGLSWAECLERCPPEVSPACHNAADSVTVSGPPAAVDAFVKKLQAEGAFARGVNSSGVAFHSRYIATAAPALRSSLERVIPSPRPRTSRWISSSVPESRWGEPLCALSSAAYHVNNLLSPVLFSDALKHVPADALVVELAPHALLQAVLRRALPEAKHVAMLRRDTGLPHLLRGLGEIYAGGAQPRLSELWPASFPVPRGTPRLASAVEWDHSTEWDVADFSKAARGGENVLEFDLSRADDSYIAGHKIDGRVLFPATGYLTLVWRTMAKLQNTKLEETPLVLEDVQFRRATIMPREGAVKFLVSVLSATGQFEVCEGGAPVVTGRARVPESDERLVLPEPEPDADLEHPLPLSGDDLYKELRLRGYDYAGAFRGMKGAHPGLARGELTWDGNWISFMDTMLQFSICGEDARQLYLPTRLQRAVIDPRIQPAHGAVPVARRAALGVVSAGGVEFRGVKVSLAPRRGLQAPPKLERYTFVPDDTHAVGTDDGTRARRDALLVCLHAVLENAGALRLKLGEMALDRSPEALLSPTLLELLEAEPQVRAEACVCAPSGYGGAVLSAAGIRAASRLDEDCHVAAAADVLARHGREALASLAAAAPKGFVLLEEPRGAFDSPAAKKLLDDADLALVSRQAASNGEVLLLRRKVPAPADSVVVHVSEEEYSWVSKLKEAMARAASDDALRVYVWGYSDGGALGLATCLRAEPGGRGVRLFLLPRGEPAFSPTHARYKARVALDLAVNELRGGAWGAHRHLPLPPAGALQLEHAYVNTLTRGDLASLRWIESPLRHHAALAAMEGARPTELCRVYYAPLNFRDIMLATGKLPPDALPGELAGQDCVLGLEFAGRDSRGRRVMGMVAARGLATTVQADPGFLWEVPAEWSLEQAATVPVAYATAYYALAVRGRMRAGEAVLIHAGSGGVGQAAIAICLAAGLRVFTTAGTADKRDFLVKRFPGLRAEDVGNSRDCSFEQLVLSATGGRGVQLVLNSLAADKLQASLRCLAIGGRFLEIGKLDLSNNSELGMAIFLKNTTFHGILLDALFDAGPECEEKREVVRLVTAGIRDGHVRPLPSTVFPETQLEPAFRYMATGRHVGKVLLRVREEEPASVSPRAALVTAVPRTYLYPDKCYILVGGLGGFGLELAGWLLTRGASRLVLASRGGVRQGYQAWRLRKLRAAGAKILLANHDVTNVEGARALIKDASKLGPVGGIFNLAAVLRDAFLENLSEDDFRAVSAPKLDATRALDRASRELAPELDHFVAFSSVSCGRGNAGQTNYGFANSAMERLCEARQADGLPALAVQWGAVGDVGLVLNTLGDNDTVVGGTLPQRIASCLDTLGELMALPHPVAASMVPADKRRSAAAPTQDLVHAVANILGLKDANKVPANADLAELGMDSLMGAEIKQTLERGYDIVLGVQEIRALTFGKLRELAGPAAGGAAPAAGGPAPTPTPAAPAENPAAPEQELVQMAAMNELMPKQTVVVMPSLSDTGSRPVFMLHPIEGSVEVLREVAACVRGRVLGLQCTAEAPLGDMAQLAQHYVRQLRAHQPTPPYLLMGYSFGAGVAFEMALQLESAGAGVRLVLVDGSPDYLAVHTGRRRGPRNEAADQAAALAFFAHQLAALDQVALVRDLEALPAWPARAALAAERLRAAGVRSPGLEAAAHSFYRKLVLMDTYRPTERVRCDVTLFTASDNFVALEPDYGLRARCVRPPTLRQLSGNHRSILSGPPARTVADHLSELLAQ